MTIRSAIPLLLIIYFSILQMSCKDDPPVVPPQPSILVSEEDIGVTDVWVKIATQHIILPSSVTLQRNGAALSTFTLTTSDTVIADTTVQPKQSYAYTAIIQNITSNQLQVSTMDTTSHNFTWQTFTFGGESGTGSSVLYDVAIINDTLAYAVGNIHIKDSAGNVITYNAIKWDGKNWTLFRIFMKDFGGGTGYYTLYSVIGFFPNDIWFVGDGELIQWNGNSFISKAFFMTSIPFTGQVRKMWGTDANNIYCVGLGGAIYNYNGSSWTKLESGTSSTINDIWGAVDQQSGERTILCAVTNHLSVGDKKLLSINAQNKVDTITWMPQREIHSVWFSNSKSIITAGDGIFLRNYLYQWKELTGITGNYTESVRGIAMNDIIIVGDFGTVLHFNGTTWQSYTGVIEDRFLLRDCDYKNKMMITIGTEGGVDGTARILMGKHN